MVSLLSSPQLYPISNHTYMECLYFVLYFWINSKTQSAHSSRVPNTILVIKQNYGEKWDNTVAITKVKHTSLEHNHHPITICNWETVKETWITYIGKPFSCHSSLSDSYFMPMHLLFVINFAKDFLNFDGSGLFIVALTLSLNQKLL